MTSLTHKAQEVFAGDLYATEVTGAEVELCEAGHARCTMAIGRKHCNAMGGVMGGAIFTLADLAFAAAANSEQVAQGEGLAWVSVGSEIHYLAQPKGDHLNAESTCVKQGRTMCVYDTVVKDEEGRKIATVTTTGMKTGTKI